MKILKSLFGTERKEYKADVISWDYTSYVPELLLGPTGSGITIMEYSMNNTVPAKEYRLRFRDKNQRKREIYFVTNENAPFPNFLDVTLVEDVVRVFGMPVRKFCVKSGHGTEMDALAVKY